MLLSEQIRQTVLSFREGLPAELSALVEQGAGEISALGIVENALTVGDTAPDFALADHKGNTKAMRQYLEKGPLVVTFYRGLWCPYCNLQLAAYNAALKDFRKTGADLVAINPEGPGGVDIVTSSDMPAEAKGMIVADPDFDVLHDVDNRLAQKFGLVFDLPDAHKQILKTLNIDVERNGDNGYTFADPATYIIGMDGEIKWAFVPNNYRRRAEPAHILEQLNKL